MNTNQGLAHRIGQFALTVLWSAQAIAASSIAGTIADQNGQPVQGGRVLAIPQSAKGGVANRKTSAPSAADGSFSLDGLGAGTYTLCAQVPGSQFIDPCRWSVTPLAVTLSDSQAFAGVQINLQQGAMLKIHIHDPKGFLTANEGKTPGANLLVGVWTDSGLFYPAAVATKDAGGREHRLVVPYERALRLSVYSKFYTISDAQKTPITDSGAGTPVQVSTGVSLKELVFYVDGLAVQH